jgi:hypothetical protein
MSAVDVERSSQHYDIPADIIRKLEALDGLTQLHVSLYITSTFIEVAKRGRAQAAFDAAMREPLCAT